MLLPAAFDDFILWKNLSLDGFFFVYKSGGCIHRDKITSKRKVDLTVKICLYTVYTAPRFNCLQSNKVISCLPLTAGVFILKEREDG